VPEGSKRDQFIKWATELPDKEQPFWIGLPNNAEKLLKAGQGLTLLSQISLMQTVDDEAAIAAAAAGDGDAGGADALPEWMKHIGDDCTDWLGLLPDDLDVLEMTAESIKDPLFRFYNREVQVGSRLLKLVRKELTELEGVCNGTVKLNNQLNALKENLIRGTVPKTWLGYPVPRDISPAVWVSDFAQRTTQLISIVAHAKGGKSLHTMKVWLGGLMEPEAFFTASRQCIAQAEGVSLEQLRMVLLVPDGSYTALKTDLVCTDLRFESAKAANDTISITENIYNLESTTILRWTTEPCSAEGDKRVNLPIYLNCTRGELLAFVDFGAVGTASEGTFYARGAAVICSVLGSA